MLGDAVTVPGPPGGLWTVSLLLWALGAVVVGEAVRGSVARLVPSWRTPEPVERLLLDLYLGGAAMYLVAAIRLGVFVAPVVFGIPILAGAVVVYRVGGLRHRAASAAAGRGILAGLWDRWVWVAIVSALGLYLVEMAAALPVATGNTYDSSLLTTYVALLLQHGSLPLSFRPYGTPAILYPQGTTVWLAWAQLDFGLPAARTSLLVTPLFLGLAPLAGFVLGRRLVGSSRAGAAFAIALAWLGPSTRALVGGSNDFAIAFPLVLLLAAQSTLWFSRHPPELGDAFGFGLLLGYSAAINVIGAEWLLPTLILLGGSARPSFGDQARRWFARWSAALAAALLAGIPSLNVLLEAREVPSSLSGALSAPAGTPVGIGVAQWIGSIDPFLFRPGDIELSPIPLVRLELAVLLVLGAALLLQRRTERLPDDPWSTFSRWSVSTGIVLVAWLGVLVAAGIPGSPLRFVAFISSAAEFSLWLFTVFGLVASVPLALAFRSFLPPETQGPPPSAAPRAAPRPPLGRAFLPVAFAILVVVPAVALTPTSLSSVLSSTYGDFGNVSASDFELFDYAGAHFAEGTRVLVAPGSAAEFLPGYVRGIVLVYPMAPGLPSANASYVLVVHELTNGTLDLAGRRALAVLDVSLVVVTGNNTVLWPAFWASALRDAEVNATPTFPVLWHEGDAWVFNASACRIGAPACS